jgi:hypothetical protein
MKKKYDYKMVIAGVFFLIVGLMCVNESPKAYATGGVYRVTQKIHGNVVSDDLKTGGQLNAEEPTRIKGVQIMGAIFLCLGGVLLYSQVKDKAV